MGYVLQSTIANLKAFIPTLEAAFTAAGIPQRESWGAAGDAILAQLEAETEAVRRGYTALQLLTPPAEQPEPKAAPAPTSTDREYTFPGLEKVTDTLEQPGAKSQLPLGAATLPHEPQGDDEDDGFDIDEEGDAGGPRASDVYAWTGDVI